MEVWKPVLKYKGRYLVSNIGRVMRAETGKILVPFRRGPYLSVDLSIKDKKLSLNLHALVCEAFHGKRPPGLHVAHLNGKHLDNRAENLAWVTPQENARHKKLHGTQPLGEIHPNAKLTREQVLDIRKRASEGVKAGEMAKEFNVKRETIYGVINRITYRCYLGER